MSLQGVTELKCVGQVGAAQALGAGRDKARTVPGRGQDIQKQSSKRTDKPLGTEAEEGNRGDYEQKAGV